MNQHLQPQLPPLFPAADDEVITAGVEGGAAGDHAVVHHLSIHQEYLLNRNFEKYQDLKHIESEKLKLVCIGYYRQHNHDLKSALLSLLDLKPDFTNTATKSDVGKAKLHLMERLQQQLSPQFIGNDQINFKNIKSFNNEPTNF